MKIAISKLIRLAFLSTWASTAFSSPVFSMPAGEQPNSEIVKSLCAKENGNLPMDSAMPHFTMSQQFELAAPVTAIAWSPNGEMIGTSEEGDTIIKIWNSQTGRLIQTIHKTYQGSKRLLFSKDGKFIITSFAGNFDGKSRGALTIVNVSTGKTLKDVDGPRDPSNFVMANDPADFVLSPDGSLLYVRYNSDNRITYYDTASWMEVGSFESSAAAMTAGPQSDQLAIVEIAPSTNIRPGPPVHGVPTMISDSHTNVEIWSATTKEFIQKFELESPISPGSVVVDPISCRIIIGDYFVPNKNMHPLGIWALSSGSKLDEIPGVGPITGLSLSPSGNLLAVAGGDKMIVLRDINQLSKPVFSYQFHDYAWRVEFSPDGKRIMMAGDKKVVIFEIR